MDERWDELWTNTLKPWLDELEVERKQALRHRLYCLAGGFALCEKMVGELLQLLLLREGRAGGRRGGFAGFGAVGG